MFISDNDVTGRLTPNKDTTPHTAETAVDSFHPAVSINMAQVAENRAPGGNNPHRQLTDTGWSGSGNSNVRTASRDSVRAEGSTVKHINVDRLHVVNYITMDVICTIQTLGRILHIHTELWKASFQQVVNTDDEKWTPSATIPAV